MPEPGFTQTISSRTVCDYLYFYYWYALVLAALTLFGAVGTILMMKGPLINKLGVGLMYAFVLSLAVLLALSLYIICERGLKPDQNKNETA